MNKPAAMNPDDQVLEFGYINYRGEYDVRRVIPWHIWFGATEYHTTPQWFMRAMDLDKGDYRDFALTDIKHFDEPTT